MKSYLLWRDNQESGPYTLEQLSALGIKTFDLLKSDENVTFWSYPSQIEELKVIVQGSEQPNSAIPSSSTHTIPVSSWISGGLFFLIACVMWIRALVHNPGNGASNALHSNAGLVHGLPEDIIPERRIDESYQNALTIEVVPVDTSQEKIAGESILSRAELLKCVQVKGNIRKNGIYEKFNDLLLHIQNSSSLLLESVTITVEITQLGGKTIKTEKYIVHDLLPKGNRTLTVSLRKKDIKVKYKITNVKRKEYKAVLVLA